MSDAPTVAAEELVAPHLKPLDGPPPADLVAHVDNSIMDGLVLEYRYTTGREYRLTFTAEDVTFQMLAAPVYKPEYAVPVALPYYARKLREHQVLVHWMVPGRVGHVALVVDFAERKIYVSALMPFKAEFFDEADIFMVMQRPK